MNDLISREEAIDALWKALYEYEDETEKKFQELKGLDVRDWIRHRIFVQNMSGIDIQTILNLPSAEPQWIPVSEKLPKYSDSVLISACDHEIDIGSYYCDTWHINGCGPVEDGTVLAWMPLPKPYKGDKE